MPETTKNSLIKIIVIFIVFTLFLISSIGLLEISIGHQPILNINSNLFNQSGNYKLALFQIFSSREFFIFFITGMLLIFGLPVLAPLKAFLLTFALLVTTFFLGYSTPDTGLIPIDFCLLTILTLYLMNVLVSYFIEINSKQQLIAMFEQYIPPALVAELSRNPDKLTLEGEAKTLTVFFCDLQNFTSISEELNPKQLNKLLNEYFTAMTEILFKDEGTIDKYIGDAIMAFWNAPTKQEAHAQRAVEAALEMNHAIRVLAKTYTARGWPLLTMGIGINTGRANVGNIGSKYRMAYTAIGDAVNLASRIESLTRTYRVPIIISENTLRQINGISCREIDVVRVRGKQQLTRIFQPLCYESEVDNKLKEKLILHKEAFELYRNKKFNNAIRLFKELYEIDHGDKYYKAMIKNILESKH